MQGVHIDPQDIHNLKASLQLCIETLITQREARISYEKLAGQNGAKIKEQYGNYITPLQNILDQVNGKVL